MTGVEPAYLLQKVMNMSNMHSRASATPMPPGAEDFKLIRGIGPGVTSRLHSAGILTFAQLAALPTNEIAELLSDLAGLSVERIAKQDWNGQARDFAAKFSTIESQRNVVAKPIRQHYATFTVELLLDESNEVRRSHVVHIQQGSEDTWGGWDDERLVDFFVQHAALRTAQIEEPSIATNDALVAAVDAHDGEELTQVIEAIHTIPQQELIEVGLDKAESATAQSETGAGRVETTRADSLPGFIGGVLRMSDLTAIANKPMLPRSFLRGGEPFNVRLTLDLTEVAAPSAETFEYQASIYAKSIGGARQIIGETCGTLMRADRVPVDVESIGLQTGTYRLEAIVSMDQPSHAARSRPGLRAMLESSLIQVC